MKTVTTNRLRLALLFPAFVLSALQSFSLSALSAGPGSYQYHDAETGKTLNVWYYKPAGFDPQTPVLIVMHGMNRNADAYRDSWIEHAKREKLMLLTPEFSKENFPGSNAYNFGNYMAPDKKINPREKWSFLIVERIFDDFIKTREKTDARQYYIYGHSAGSQFVHRYLLLVPQARVRLAISANAGFYTVPDAAEDWPWGLKGTSLAQEDVNRYLSAPLVVLLGDKDNDPKAANFPRGMPSDKQGVSRLARGVYFFNFAQAAAEKLDIPFGWKIRTVPGAHHSDPLMAPAAAKVIAEDIAAMKDLAEAPAAAKENRSL